MIKNLLKTLLIATATLVPAGAVAATYDFAVDGIYYTITSSTDLTVSTSYASTSYNSYTSSSVTIPSTVTYDGTTYTVTGIGSSTFRKCTSVTSVTMPSTITTMGDYVFRDCTGLASVELSENITSIGNYAFYNCSSLSSLNLPKSTTAIGNYMCYGCASLETVTFPDSLETIGTYAFRGCTELLSVALPNTVTSVGDQFCYGCTALTSASLGNSITSVGTYTFSGCSKLASFTIPATLTAVSNYMFRGTAITSIDIPAAIASIGSLAFAECYSLTAINVDEGNEYFSSVDGALLTKDATELLVYPAGKTEFSVPSTVTSIDMYGCRYCSSLTTVTLPSQISEIGLYAFAQCTALTTMDMSNSAIDTIGMYTFSDCTSLSSITFPDGILHIDGYVFSKCTSLTAVTLPATLLSMGSNTFSSATNITEVNSLNSTPPTIKTNSFNSTILANATLYVPTGCKDTYAAATYWSNFTNIEEKDFSATTADYTITTAAEWNALAELMATDSLDLTGKVVLIANDIDFNGDTIKPLGYDRVTLFNGELDGNGKTISNFVAVADASFYGALATVTGTEAYIHDITIAGTVTSSYSYTGSAVGEFHGTMANVTNNATVVGSGNYTAGIAAYVIGAKVSQCTNTGSIYAIGTGGAGIASYSENSTFTNCSNSGVLTGYSSYNGGILAHIRGCYVDTCENYGAITGGSFTGGIVGIAYSIDSLEIVSTLTACSNEGEVYSTGWAGGIAGYLSESALVDCTNKAPLTATGAYSGGVVGQLLTSTASGCVNDTSATVTLSGGYSGGCFGIVTSVSTVSNCSNNANVTASGTYSGGFCGSAVFNSTFTGCVNTGKVTAEGQYSGGFCGRASNATFYDCFNEGNITASSDRCAGFCGGSYSGSDYTNCGNRGAVSYIGSTDESYIAGFIGYAEYGDYTDCFNEGAVTSAASAPTYLAGFISRISATYGISNLTRCYNTADITGDASLGGLTSYIGSKNYINMSGCYNTGNITSTSSTSSTTKPIAGLMAFFTLGSTYTDCWNSGDITANGSGVIGGLFGAKVSAQKTSDTLAVVVKRCYNLGNVTTQNNTVGGIFGTVQAGYFTIDSCYNTGNITGNRQAGGILGSLNGSTSAPATISNCWNAGNITTAQAYSGGIVGNLMTCDTLLNCFNTGNVATTSETEGTTTSCGLGIGGIAGRLKGAIINAYNCGTVTGASAVGGIAGLPVKGYVTVTGCYTTGTVNAVSTLCGNVIGAGTDNSTYWGTSDVMNQTYYLTANAVECTDTVSVGLSYAELAKLDLGDGWTAGDNYTYPRLTTLADNDYAKAYAAAVIPADGDGYSSITTGFNVGTPDGVTWTASSGSVEIDGNNVTFSESFSGTLTMTATSGDVSVATELTCNVTVTGISDITGGGREVVSERFYNLAGAQVAEPTDGARAIYIVVKSYNDGTTETVKEVR